MVRWRLVLALAVLLLIPRMSATTDDVDDEDEQDEGEDDEDEEDEEDEEESSIGPPNTGVNMGPSQPKNPVPLPDRRSPILVPKPKAVTAKAVTQEVKKPPLECYVCAFKTETPLNACLDPLKFRVHTITCHSVDDRCFTAVISKANTYEAVVRGCRTGCVASTDTTCCEHNRCNNQAFAIPQIQPKARKEVPVLTATAKANNHSPPTILYFVSILLILQTATKVAFV